MAECSSHIAYPFYSSDLRAKVGTQKGHTSTLKSCGQKLMSNNVNGLKEIFVTYINSNACL
ncbi:hypothetical protein KSB_61440 [Ktedonobacter robiniae]|uniref:Uncharacterized protein n=1 Tax=Ktedonobacter robiniae TaxID=2778365 RepID=A0ABQ3UYC8_9CHLR|nr:hypothetical protein KSB_61440 [Ktedonobacter robiniae]